MNSTFNVEIKFESDWHVGEGAGIPRSIDRIIRRHPEDRLPYVPAKTLTGIWRDACEAVAAGLDAGQKNHSTWASVVDAVFGDQPSRRERQSSASPPLPARLEVRSARLPQALRAALAQAGTRGAQLVDAMVLIKPGVEIDDASGQAKEKHLHNDEVVRRGGVYEGAATLDCTDLSSAAIDAVHALLWAGLATARRLGGKRRRGLGRCALSETHLQAQRHTYRAILAAEPPEIKPVQTAPIGIHTGQNATPTSWECFDLVLDLQTPVVVATRTLGNVVESAGYIPGTFLLSHVSRALTQFLGDRAGAEIAAGNIRVLNAYLDVNGTRGLPPPRCLARDKRAGVTQTQQLWNLASEKPPGGFSPKPPRGDALLPDPRLPLLASLSMQQTTHSTIDEEAQRPTEDVVGVFTFQAIPAGTRLRSELRLPAPIAQQLPADWPQKLNGELRIGTAKKDDYGLALLQVGAKPHIPSPAQNAGIMVWLASDILLRTSSLTATAARSALIDALDPGGVMGLHVREDPTFRSSFLAAHRSDGWQARWGLPRPSYIGIAAGSCVVLEGKGTIDWQRLHDTAQAGIGERRAEGFGEIRINDALLLGPTSHLSFAPPAPATGSPPSATLRPAHRAYARQLEELAWDKMIVRLCASRACNAEFRDRSLGWKSGGASPKPPNSQLGVLRSVLARLDRPADSHLIADWLRHLEDSPNRRDKWLPEARQTLRALAQQPQKIWDWLGIDDGDPDLPLLGSATTEIKEALWARAVRCLFLAAMRSEKAAREKGAGGAK